MTPATASESLGRWNAEGRGPSVEYADAVMEGIRAAVVEGFYRIPHGGIEVGGVMFGRREGNSVRVLGFRPLPCEHAFGPSFVLSERDTERLRKLLASANTDDSLGGMIPVGWYLSHTRSSLHLAERDLEIYNHFFPEPWQITLVLKPERSGPVKAGFFIRESDGAVRTESSYSEFVVDAVRRKKGATGTAEPPKPEAAAPEPEAAPKPEAAPEPEAPPTVESLPEFPVPGVLMTASPRRRLRLLLLLSIVGIVVVGSVVGATLFWLIQRPDPAGQPLSLSARDVEGQLEVMWARPAGNVSGGVLEITDGGADKVLHLDAAQVIQGGLTYVRQSGDVTLRLKLNPEPKTGNALEELIDQLKTRMAGAQNYEAHARFVGPPPSLPAPPEDAQESEDLTAEVEKLRDELQKQNGRNRDLEVAIKALRSRLELEQKRP